MEVYRTQATVQAIIDSGEAKDSSKTAAAFKKFLEAAFPFASKVRAEVDEKMKKVMKDWVALGPISFTPVSMSPLRDRAKMRQRGDEYSKQVMERGQAARRRK